MGVEKGGQGEKKYFKIRTRSRKRKGGPHSSRHPVIRHPSSRVPAPELAPTKCPLPPPTSRDPSGTSNRQERGPHVRLTAAVAYQAIIERCEGTAASHATFERTESQNYQVVFPRPCFLLPLADGFISLLTRTPCTSLYPQSSLTALDLPSFSFSFYLVQLQPLPHLLNLASSLPTRLPSRQTRHGQPRSPPLTCPPGHQNTPPNSRHSPISSPNSRLEPRIPVLKSLSATAIRPKSDLHLPAGPLMGEAQATSHPLPQDNRGLNNSPRNIRNPPTKRCRGITKRNAKSPPTHPHPTRSATHRAEAPEGIPAPARDRRTDR